MMAVYFFKLLGGFGSRSEMELSLNFDLSVAEVKEIVKKEFKILPQLKIDFMVGGRKLPDDMKWGMTDVKPMKTNVLVIGHR